MIEPSDAVKARASSTRSWARFGPPLVAISAFLFMPWLLRTFSPQHAVLIDWESANIWQRGSDPWGQPWEFKNSRELKRDLAPGRTFSYSASQHWVAYSRGGNGRDELGGGDDVLVPVSDSDFRLVAWLASLRWILFGAACWFLVWPELLRASSGRKVKLAALGCAVCLAGAAYAEWSRRAWSVQVTSAYTTVAPVAWVVMVTTFGVLAGGLWLVTQAQTSSRGVNGDRDG